MSPKLLQVAGQALPHSLKTFPPRHLVCGHSSARTHDAPNSTWPSGQKQPAARSHVWCAQRELFVHLATHLPTTHCLVQAMADSSLFWQVRGQLLPQVRKTLPAGQLPVSGDVGSSTGVESMTRGTYYLLGHTSLVGHSDHWYCPVGRSQTDTHIHQHTGQCKWEGRSNCHMTQGREIHR